MGRLVHRTLQTSNEMGYSSWRPHLAVTKTQDTEATFQQPHQNWTRDDVA